MAQVLFKNCSLFDGLGSELLEGRHVLVEGERIKEVSDRPITASEAEVIDIGGRTLMPGLIDAHFHAMAADPDFAKMEVMPRSLLAQHARHLLEAALARGFTSVRDAGGADYGLAMAIKAGLIKGPRLFYSGRALTQTGGHADFRALEDHSAFCFCGQGSHVFGVIADGVPAVRQAARDELRKGATQIKIMASGGVASPSDPIWNLQYSEEEIRAIVWEAASWRTYVMAHAYTPEAITRCVQFGVRSIEHANLIDEPTAALCAAEGAFVVPTLVTYDALHRFGPDLGLPAVSQEKLKAVRAAGLVSLEILKAAGVTIGFGTDLLGDMQAHQSGEFQIRAEVLSPAEILRSATSVNAALLNAEGELGVVAAEAQADLIVVDGDPLADLSLLQDQGARIPMIMKAGSFAKREAL
ncbi:amidohydrolase family protein [Pelagibius litoralis]|uniref:Amidohydrolase family protein n=1 Tax=Pelagibius litoralis TaxID=374515 RepID=A0A967KDD1_9PROT|nr:amidohydrolase family protein [Pelagibius litoralis]NIA70155.1 amidohydrolase family protein [Pelagibius litoralis]